MGGYYYDNAFRLLFCAFSAHHAQGIHVVQQSNHAESFPNLRHRNLQSTIDEGISVDGGGSTAFSLIDWLSTDATTQLFRMSPNPIPGGSPVTCYLTCDRGSEQIFWSMDYAATHTAFGQGSEFGFGTACPTTGNLATVDPETGWVEVFTNDGSGTSFLQNAVLYCRSGFPVPATDATITVNGGTSSQFSLLPFAASDLTTSKYPLIFQPMQLSSVPSLATVAQKIYLFICTIHQAL